MCSFAHGRGALNVGITGRHDQNIVLVVTDTDDIGEARDTLERVLTTDRADTPVFTQRRQLTEQCRRAPRLQPRCVIPHWFNDTYTAAVNALDQAQAGVDDARQHRQQLSNDLHAALICHQTANHHCVPYDTELRSARDALPRRRSTQNGAPSTRRRLTISAQATSSPTHRKRSRSRH
jgi:hypothetical protein